MNTFIFYFRFRYGFNFIFAELIIIAPLFGVCAAVAAFNQRTPLTVGMGISMTLLSPAVDAVKPLFNEKSKFNLIRNKT